MLFWEGLDQSTQDTSRRAFDIFDQYGLFRDDIKTHSIKKGSCIWGDEFDLGDLLIIDKLFVRPSHRRQGIGHRLVNAMVEKARTKYGTFFVIVLATARDELVDHECSITGEKRDVVYCREEQMVQHFWRSLGFRRVGESGWFALAGDKNHGCHNLSAKDDYDPLNFPKHPALPQIENVLKRAGSCHGPHPNSTFGLFLEGERTLKGLDVQNWDKDIMPRFQNLALGHVLWGPLDSSGNTILHVAARRSDSQSVDMLLKQNSSLSSSRNHHGETPLEALEQDLENQRSISLQDMKMMCISDNFSGFSDKTVQALIRIKGLTNPSSDEVARLKYGCTCG